VKYILILLIIFSTSCQSIKEIPTSERFNLVDNGHNIMVYNEKRIGQLVCNDSFIFKESIYYDNDFNKISSSISGLYPHYLEIFDKNQNYIGDINLVKTYSSDSKMFFIINDIESSIIYKTNAFSNLPRTISFYCGDVKSATIRCYDGKWSMIIYDNKVNINLFIHLFKSIKGLST